MKINASDGSIIFNSGLIQPGIDRAQLLRTATGWDAQEKLVNELENWREIFISPERNIAAILIFQAETLHQIYLSLKLPADGTSEWTTTIELERKATHDAWLLAELGAPPYSYSWGKITSEFDAKGCASEIIVSYAK